MSKRDLKKYLKDLNKEQLENQILELYEKFSEVKVYYDFVFNPKEEQLIREARLKISNEYFPVRSKRAKLRRSVAQKFIKHYLTLGVDAFLIADLMLFNIEIAQAYSSEKIIKPELLYKSMLNSFEQAIAFLMDKGILDEFKDRLIAINQETISQKWSNKYEFIAILERLDY